mgnify:CR=1 FL=1
MSKNWPRLDRRKVRAQRALSGVEDGVALAERLGVAKTTYYAWELGTRRIPPEKLKALAEVLGVAQKKLVGA